MVPNHTCLAVIRLDSALNKCGNFYPQLSLYILKKNVIRHINDDWRDFSYSDESHDLSFIICHLYKMGTLYIFKLLLRCQFTKHVCIKKLSMYLNIFVYS